MGQVLASGESLDAAPPAGGLVGRSAEQARVAALLEAARGGHGGVLAVTGEAGIGKTRLLTATAAHADGFQRLWASGIESEAAFGHAALLELLTPLRDLLPTLPTTQRTALAAALGWEPPGASGDRFLVAGATLTMLAAAAERTPLLVVVDDLHWVDRESAGAILFAARRMHHDPVAFLLSTRDGDPATRHRDQAAAPGGPAPVLDGVDVLPLVGLPVAEAQRLLHGEVAPQVVTRLVSQVHGNPLALLELARRLTPAQRWGAAELPDQLPVGRRLEAVYEPALAGLSPLAWQAVLLLAAAHDGAAAHLTDALRQPHEAVDAVLDELEQRQIVVRAGPVPRLRHPLLRSAAWRLATARERRRAHEALAAASADATSRTWHLAEAAAGRDDGLAGQLATLAHAARGRRSFAAASVAWERMAALATDPDRSATALADAAGDAFVAGDLDRARALAERVLREHPDRRVRGDVQHTLGVLEQYAGAVPAAVDRLRDAADMLDGRRRVRALVELAMSQYRLNRLEDMHRTATEARAGADPAEPAEHVLATFVLGTAQVLTGRTEPGLAHLRRASTQVEADAGLRDDPRLLVHVMLAQGWLGLDHAGWPEIDRRLRLARERGALSVLVPALAMRSYARMWIGDHAGAFADAGEAAELGTQLRFVADAAPAREMLAWQLAARGLHDDAARELAHATALVQRAGTADAAAHLALTAAFCALCRGDLAEVVRLLEARMASDGGRGSMGEPLGVAPLLVEAYAGLRRGDDAAALARRYADAVTAPLPATTALVARCHALAASADAVACRRYEDALAAHAGSVDRFEAARTRLLYGSALRRAGRRVDARSQLQEAHDAFAAWDLTHWARLAEAELRATGASARPRRALAQEPLTSQETRIATLVAQGLSNREVAAALFLSPKTIEHHLSRVYRKRGWRSRSELARAFAGAAQHPPRTAAGAADGPA